MENKLIVSLHANNKGMELKPVHNNGKNFNTVNDSVIIIITIIIIMTKYLLCTVENIQVPHWTSVLVFGAAAAAAAAVVVVVVASAGSDVLLHIMVVDLVSVHNFAAVGTDGLQLLVACGAAPVVLGVHVA